MKAPAKTQATRLLDRRGIPYDEVIFPPDIHDALGVARYAGLPAEIVYKTLVVLVDPPATRPALILEPADAVLDLKLAARGMGAKRVKMASQAEAERLTGLQVGGISALVLTHLRWPVFIDRRGESLDRIVVSAGVRGRNLRVRVVDFIQVTGARWIDAAREEGLPRKR